MRFLDDEHPADAAAIDGLLDAAFGANRRQRTAYRFRDRAAPVAGLGFVMREGNRLVGSVRFWPVRVGAAGGEAAALLLGPLAVDPGLRRGGVGTALLHRGLAAVAERGGEEPVFLIGDLGYYGRVGFRRVLPSACAMPGPVEAERVLFWNRDPDYRLPPRFRLQPVEDGLSGTFAPPGKAEQPA